MVWISELKGYGKLIGLRGCANPYKLIDLSDFFSFLIHDTYDFMLQQIHLLHLKVY